MGLFGDDDRTEQPTGRKLQEARKKGQIARSVRAPRAASLAAALGVFLWMGEAYVQTLAATLTSGLDDLDDVARRTIVEGALVDMVVGHAATLGLVVGPLAVAIAVAIVAVQVAQGGMTFSLEPLAFDLQKLSPAAGMKRLMGQGPMNLLMMVVPVSVVAYLAFQVVSPRVANATLLARMTPTDAALAFWDTASSLLTRVTVALTILAGADYGFQRWQFMKGQRMTKQEVKDENKMTDGNPLIKSRLRGLQRDAHRKRMLANVASATVVITNPTHFAVALEYHRQSMGAPRVVAKGRDKLALRIKEIARDKGIPTVENKPLAQALYWNAEVGEFIPANLFGAVAEVLAYLIRLKQLSL